MPTPKGAWTVASLLFVYMMVNFADKAVVGLAAVPIMKEMGLSPKQYGALGSSFFLLFSLSGILVGFVANRRPTRWIILVLAASWALVQFPMLGAVGFTTLLICRIALGAGEGPGAAVAVHAVYKWFPDEKRTMPTAILSQGAAIGVIVALPVLNWIIVHYSWHWAFGTLGFVGLAWVVAWYFVGRDGPIKDPPMQVAGAERVGYGHILLGTDVYRLRAGLFRRLLVVVAGPDLVHPLRGQGPWVPAIQRRVDRGTALDGGRLPGVAGGLGFPGSGRSRRVDASRARRARRGPADRGRVADRAFTLGTRRGRKGRVAGVGDRVDRADLCGVRANDLGVHANAATRRDDRDLRRDLYAGRCNRAVHERERDRRRRDGARWVPDRLSHLRRDADHGRDLRTGADVARRGSDAHHEPPDRDGSVNSGAALTGAGGASIVVDKSPRRSVRHQGSRPRRLPLAG